VSGISVGHLKQQDISACSAYKYCVNFWENLSLHARRQVKMIAWLIMCINLCLLCWIILKRYIKLQFSQFWNISGNCMNWKINNQTRIYLAHGSVVVESLSYKPEGWGFQIPSQ
jgi:hypothetical protein